MTCRDGSNCAIGYGAGAIGTTADIAQDVPRSGAKRAPVELIPADMLTTSGSGLDPHISPAYAALQVRRVAAARGVPEEYIAAVLARHIAGRTFGIFGEPRVNVLQLNLGLQHAHPVAGPSH